MSSEDEAPAKPTTTAKPAMSRFLRTAGSESSSSESEEESGESDADEGEEGESGSDEEDKPQTRILSAVDKRLKEMEATGKVMENGLKINDWAAVSNGAFIVPISLNISSISIYVSYRIR